MKLWLTKNTEIPMRQQLVTQIILGVASGDLQMGEKIPSRQEISRRFDIHPNTVSNAYSELKKKGLIEYRKGSGFFVSEIEDADLEDRVDLDSVVTRFLETAKSLGFSNEEVRESLERRLANEPSQSFVVIENDDSLRDILVEEISMATGRRVFGISLSDFEGEQDELDANFVALSDERQKVENLLNSANSCRYLLSRSIPESMKGEERPSEESIIAIVSGWDQFLQMARTILIAAEIDSDSIVVRSTSEPGWKRGLESAEMIICDALAAKSLGNVYPLRPFKIISAESIEELKKVGAQV